MILHADYISRVFSRLITDDSAFASVVREIKSGPRAIYRVTTAEAPVHARETRRHVHYGNAAACGRTASRSTSFSRPTVTPIHPIMISTWERERTRASYYFNLIYTLTRTDYSVGASVLFSALAGKRKVVLYLGSVGLIN